MVARIAEDECAYALVDQVTIKAFDETTLTFAARSGSKTGDPHECLLRLFRVPLRELYTQPIAGAPAAVAMTPGATGPLYLSRDGWRATSEDGFPIHGAEQAVFKWPDCAATPTPPLTRLAVLPSSILVQGQLDGEAELVSVELLGPDATESQDLDWTSAAPVELQLTEHGAHRLHVTTTTVQLWPTRIVVQGAPAIDQAVSGEVDVLDRELAASAQRIAYGTRGAPISLVLTQDGITAFHVTPQAIAEGVSVCIGSAADAGSARPLPGQGGRLAS